MVSFHLIITQINNKIGKIVINKNIQRLKYNKLQLNKYKASVINSI